ncbi:putative leader peptide [Streptomyces sp. B1866]
MFCRAAVVPPRGRVRLYRRTHIDLLRVAGALCCS